MKFSHYWFPCKSPKDFPASLMFHPSFKFSNIVDLFDFGLILKTPQYVFVVFSLRLYFPIRPQIPTLKFQNNPMRHLCTFVHHQTYVYQEFELKYFSSTRKKKGLMEEFQTVGRKAETHKRKYLLLSLHILK